MDRPFHFRLERVRSLRERAEDQAREELASGLAHRRDGAAALQAADSAVRDALDLTRDALRSGATGIALRGAQAFVERTRSTRESAALDLDRRDAEVDARRAALLAAASEREILDRLKRRARAIHEAASARHAQGVLDEIALSVHRRARAAA